MKFRFRLEKVLEYRKRLEDEAKRNYLLAKASTEAALHELEMLYRSIDEARARAPMSQAAELQRDDVFIAGQKLRIEQKRIKIRELKEEEERTQEILADSAKEKKTLVRLKERKFDEFKKEVQRLENLEADEFSVMRYKRGEGL